MGSKLTINTAFDSQLIEVPEESRKGLRPRRVLSSIASSSDEHKSQGMLNRIRESRSLDPLPLAKIKQLDVAPVINMPRSTKSLDNCENCGDVQIIAIPEDKLLNNNFPNGNVTRHEDNSWLEDVEVPLLNPTQQKQISVRRRGGSTFNDCFENDTSNKK